MASDTVDGSAFGQELFEDLTRRARGSRQQTELCDTSLRADCEAFLFREARLLDGAYYDDSQFDVWLDLFTADCVYWVPIDPDGGDPRSAVSLHLDDKRRLVDLVEKLRTGWAHSQMPMSRTRRLVSNVEAWQDELDDHLVVRANFIIWEWRREHLNPYAGWYEFLLDASADEWKIRRKIVNLVNSDAGFSNLSFFL